MEKRKSNLELLRIISIFMIIIFHCSFKSGFNFPAGFNVNKFIVKCFWMLGELGVNLFILISGYCMVNSRFKWKKLIRLLLEVQIYWWFSILISGKLNIYKPSGWKEILLSFFPVLLNRYWFITAYILVYVFSPYLNILIKAMDKKIYRKFLLTSLVLFCVIPTFFGLFFNNTEGMLYYTRMIWLLIMYFLGAYIYTKRPYFRTKMEKTRFAGDSYFYSCFSPLDFSN